MLGEIGGAIVSGLFGREGQRSANAANRQEAHENRVFQEAMSNSAHQREVNDLKKAGLNPILSVNAGASSPAGGQAAAAQNTNESFAASAKEIAMQIASIKKMKAEGELLAESAIKTKNEAYESTARAAAARASEANTKKQTEMLDAQLPFQQLKGKFFQGIQSGVKKIPVNKKDTPLNQKLTETQNAIRGAN